MIDFTNCKIIPGRVYNGANGSKIAVELEGVIYMLKFPPSAKQKRTMLSYSNGCISEHLASSIFNICPGDHAGYIYRKVHSGLEHQLRLVGHIVLELVEEPGDCAVATLIEDIGENVESAARPER